MQEQDKDQFSFINEKIKKKPVNKKRFLIQACFVTGMAVVFGVVSSLTFAFFRPRFEAALYPEQQPVVTIPKDDTADTGESEAASEDSEPAGEPDSETEADPEPGTEGAEPGTQAGPEGMEPGTQAGPEGMEPGTEGDPLELEIADFQNLQDKLYAVGREANRFVVTVTGVRSDTDWFNNPYERRGQTSGIIVADNGQELLILTERKEIQDVEEIYVTFINELEVQATLKKYDGNTGIAVLSVPRASVDEATMNAIAVAQLGNSLMIPQGMIAIAVGSPLGTNYSILTGTITSTTNSVSTIDSNYTVFTTDIVGSANGSGAIINSAGEVVGLIMQDYGSVGNRVTLTAISISELKELIAMLSNNQDIPYLGLELSTVTNDIAKEYEIPKGTYIKEVVMDSPAMAAGLQSGDVVTRVNGETILTVDSYESALLSLEPGQRVEVAVQRQGIDGYEEITCMVTVSVLQW